VLVQRFFERFFLLKEGLVVGELYMTEMLSLLDLDVYTI
jgi:hypothetical protein